MLVVSEVKWIRTIGATDVMSLDLIVVVGRAVVVVVVVDIVVASIGIGGVVLSSCLVRNNSFP